MPIRPAIGMLFIAALIAALAGCGKKPTDTPTGATSVPVTEDEAREFGKQFLAALQAKDRPAFDKLMRLEEFGHRSLGDLSLSVNRDGFVKQMESAFRELFELYTTTFDAERAKVLAAISRDGKTELSVRIAPLWYLVFLLGHHPDGAVVMRDWTPSDTGEPQSATFRRTFIPYTVRKTDGRVDGRSSQRPEDSLYIQHLDTINSAEEAMKKKEYAKALVFLERLPAALQNRKSIATMRLSIAFATDEASASREFDRFMARDPDDDSPSVISIIYWLKKRDSKRGLECIDRLDKFVGGDPYLNALRFKLRGDDQFPEAKADAERLLAGEPNLVESYRTMAQILALTADFKGAAEHLKRIVTKLSKNLDLKVIAAEPDFAEFAKSKEFADLKAWADARPKK